MAGVVTFGALLAIGTSINGLVLAKSRDLFALARDRVLPRDLVVFGEVGLSGEIRPVPNGQERLAEAAKHGFKRAIVPAGNAPRGAVGGMQVTAVAKLSEALAAFD